MSSRREMFLSMAKLPPLIKGKRKPCDALTRTNFDHEPILQDFLELATTGFEASSARPNAAQGFDLAEIASVGKDFI